MLVHVNGGPVENYLKSPVLPCDSLPVTLSHLMMACQASACPEPAHADQEVQTGADLHADLHRLSPAEGYVEPTPAAARKPTPLSDDFSVSRSQLW